MLTGPRGRIFLSHRWSGEDFTRVMHWLAGQLTARGYEVVLDTTYADAWGGDPVQAMMKEQQSSDFFVAAVSPDYMSVLTGSVQPNEFGSSALHDTGNDGWVRDELNAAIMRAPEITGIGLCFGCRPVQTGPSFPFPMVEITASNEAAQVTLDECFGEPLELPRFVRPEIKHQGQWVALSESVPLVNAYLLLRRTLATLRDDKAAHYLPVSNLPYWSRIDRGHIIWERRATEPVSGGESASQVVLACPSCTAQFEDCAPEGSQCPRCRRGSLGRRLAAALEALVVLRPVDG